MGYKSKIKKAFTVMEVSVIISILAFLMIFIIKVTKERTEFRNKVQSYSALKNLKQVIGEVVATGYVDPGDASGKIQKILPPTAHTADLKGYCDLAADNINILGTVNCTYTTTSGFNSGNANFTLSNGQRYYNFGSNLSGGMVSVYVDINGANDNSVLNKDIIAFDVYQNGLVLPKSDSIAATNIKYLNAYYEVRTVADWALVSKSAKMTFRQALCESGNLDSAIAATYCSGVPVSASCTGANVCQFVLMEPLQSGFMNRLKITFK